MPIVTPQGEALAQGKVAPTPSAPAEAPAPVDTSLEAAPEEALSPKYLALAKKEKMAVRREREIARREAELKAREEEYKTKYVPKDALTSKPLQVLLDNGFTYDQIAELLLKQSDPQSQALSKYDDEIKSLKDAQRAQEEKEKQKEESQREQARSQIRAEIDALVDNNTEYETVKSLEAKEAVLQLIEETFDTTGVLLSAEEASKQIEDALVEDSFRRASLPKVKARLQPAPAAESQVQEKPHTKTPEAAKPQIKTLTHAVSATSSRASTEKERVQRAILAFKGQLNS